MTSATCGEGKRVGVFDSGVGGLTVLAACVRRLPAARFFYYGDNAHAPYGSRPPEEIARLVRRGLSRLAARGIDAAVLACNTATAVCAEQMRAEFPFPVVGMEPAVSPAAKVCRRVLVLATPRTAESERLHALIGRFPACSFRVAALPDLAGAIERHFRDGETLTLSDHLPAASCDGVVLGCTHYAFFRKEIGDFYGARVFDGADGAARRLESLLYAGSPQPPRPPFGTADHLCSAQNPNKCFTKKWKERGKNAVIFLGSGQKMDKRLYYTNICFSLR